MQGKTEKDMDNDLEFLGVLCFQLFRQNVEALKVNGPDQQALRDAKLYYEMTEFWFAQVQWVQRCQEKLASLSKDVVQ